MSSVALTALLASQPVHAQGAAEQATSTDSGALTTSASGATALTADRQSRPGPPGPPVPEFQAGATVRFSESYVSNASGLPGTSQPDTISSPGLNAYLHEHSRSLDLDATYFGSADIYNKGTLSTQFNNNLQLVGSADVIPDRFSLNARAFAQPVLISSLGAVTADNRTVPNGYSNSYGYDVNPDVKFRLGNFATSETSPSFSQAYFTSPQSQTLNLLSGLGLNGPENTTSRMLRQKFTSGADFDRLNWDLVGTISETDRTQSLLSEKTGVADLRYAIDRNFSLLATGGYDAITNSSPFSKNISGPIAMAGFGLNFGPAFSLQIQAGEKYQSPSYSGSLHWDITPRTLITASLDDGVQTPEGQLLNNLTGLTALPNGSLGSANSVLGNGSQASLSNYNVQSPGNLALDQSISRYQTGMISFSEDMERNHAMLSVFGTRRTILNGFFIGPSKVDSWGTQLQFSRDLTPLMRGSVGGSYGGDNELGGDTRTFQIQGQLNYALSRLTNIYVSVDYLDRSTSTALQALSPLTGNTNDVRATIGLSHDL